MDYAIGDKTIKLFLGDITTLAVDAIVNSANSDLWMGSGVAHAIVEAGGRQIETEARKHAPCPIGQVVVTSAGTMRAKHVIHAVVMGQDFLTDQNKIAAAAQAAIDRAEDMGLKSLAFPALGVGVGLFSPQMVAKTLIELTQKALTKCKSLRTIAFALVNEDTYRAFEKALPPSFYS